MYDWNVSYFIEFTCYITHTCINLTNLHTLSLTPPYINV